MRRFSSVVKRGSIDGIGRQLWRARRGATAVEYGLIVALIVIAMVASLQGLANQTVGTWSNINTRIATATGN